MPICAVVMLQLDWFTITFGLESLDFRNLLRSSSFGGMAMVVCYSTRCLMAKAGGEAVWEFGV